MITDSLIRGLKEMHGSGAAAAARTIYEQAVRSKERQKIIDQWREVVRILEHVCIFTVNKTAVMDASLCCEKMKVLYEDVYYADVPNRVLGLTVTFHDGDYPGGMAVQYCPHCGAEIIFEEVP